MEQVAAKHKSLIAGLTKLYDILIAMRYISSSDVVRPPHSSDSIAISQLQALGLESEVIDLIQLLPALRSEVTWGYQNWGTELAPRSKAVTYFPNPDDPDFIDKLRWGDFFTTDDASERLLPPWMLRLTEGGQYGYGVHMIYNTRDQSIVEWSHMGKKYWDEIPSRSAETVLSEMVVKLQTLEWVPLYNPSQEGDSDPPAREIIENPLIFQNIWPGGIRMPVEPTEAIASLRQTSDENVLNDMRQQINRWRALQKLYRDCGWGSESFDGEAFEVKRVDWIRVQDVLGREREEYMFSPVHQTDQHQLLRQQVEDRWHTFWTESAGEYAV